MLVVLLWISNVARADIILSFKGPQPRAASPFEIDVTLTNDSPSAKAVPVGAILRLEVESKTASTVLAMKPIDWDPGTDGVVLLGPKEFRTLRFQAQMPADVSGAVRLTAPGLEANDLVLDVQSAGTGEARPEPRAAAVPAAPKPPPLTLSTYEPMYFVVGPRGGLNAKFQISFKFRLFGPQAALADRWRWANDLYFSYSQTSLWDLDEASKPFRDSSYRPRLFYANYDLGSAHDGHWHFGVESGVGHESNGKDGAASRSLNIAYVRPTFLIGDRDGKRFYVAPEFHYYLNQPDSPLIEDYRGFADWLIGYGSKGGLDTRATLRWGTHRFGSLEVSASYPLARLSRGTLSGWLFAQYFDGYGEGLLDYNRRLAAQWRLGFALAL